jgi:hypothetical protein
MISLIRRTDVRSTRSGRAVFNPRMDVLLAGREDRRDGLDLVDELHDVRTIGQISITDRTIPEGTTEVLDECWRIPLGQWRRWRCISEFHSGNLP